jgi:hypothetical protein
LFFSVSVSFVKLDEYKNSLEKRLKEVIVDFANVIFVSITASILLENKMKKKSARELTSLASKIENTRKEVAQEEARMKKEALKVAHLSDGLSL